jgi:cyclopropane-fatty-acyl-phospholipid synthase
MKTYSPSGLQRINPFLQADAGFPAMPVTAFRIARMIANAIQMGLGNAYINGLEIPDQVLRMLCDTSARLLFNEYPSLLVRYDWLLKESTHLAEGSEELMKLQYNLPEALFVDMLGESETVYPKYTMALWDKEAPGLEQAQVDMLEDIIAKAGIKDGDEILDLGCGWGSAASYILAKFPKVKVTSLNLSHGQCEYIRRKAKEAGSHLNTPRFSLYEQDFNEAVFSHGFDRVIAIGLFEHIGNLTDSFKLLARHLKEDGKVFIHIIATTLSFSITDPYIDTYIFPRARIWSVNAIPKCNSDLKTVDCWFINGLNYSKTLQAWLANFDQCQADIKNLDYGMSYDKFRRLWRFYLQLCISYFEASDGKVLGNGQFLLEPA